MTSLPLSGANRSLSGAGDLHVRQSWRYVQYLSGFYPIVLIVWARYLLHTVLMAGIFLPQSGLRVLRTKRPLAGGEPPHGLMMLALAAVAWSHSCR
jgi:hypothetical protein